MQNIDASIILPIVTASLALAGVIIGSILTYFVERWRNNQKKVMDGIAFYRSNLPHILPIMNSMSKLESTQLTLSIALDNIIEGQRGFPVMHNGMEYLKQDELRDLIKSESKKLQILSNTGWLSIFPEILSIPITEIWAQMFGISQADWLGKPEESKEKLEKASLSFRKYRLTMKKVLGLIEAYMEISKDFPIKLQSVKEVLED